MRYAKLKGRMVEENMTQAEMAEKIGISLSALNAKMSGKREFTVQEAAMICQLLKIEEPKEYFFVQAIPNMQRMAE